MFGGLSVPASGRASVHRTAACPSPPACLALSETSAAGTEFGQDLATLYPRLYGYALKLTADRHRAEDLAQDTMMLALAAEGRFAPGTHLVNWLFTIMRNRFHTVTTRKYRTCEIDELDLDREELWSQPASQESCFATAAFKRAFKKLSPTHQRVLVLWGIHGFTYEQIAAMSHCDLDTVRSRLSRARANLRKVLVAHEAGGDPPPFPVYARLPS